MTGARVGVTVGVCGGSGNEREKNKNYNSRDDESSAVREYDDAREETRARERVWGGGWVGKSRGKIERDGTRDADKSEEVLYAREKKKNCCAHREAVKPTTTTTTAAAQRRKVQRTIYSIHTVIRIRVCKVYTYIDDTTAPPPVYNISSSKVETTR